MHLSIQNTTTVEELNPTMLELSITQTMVFYLISQIMIVSECIRSKIISFRMQFGIYKSGVKSGLQQRNWPTVINKTK